MKNLFANNPYYIEYETRLRQLHQLIADGKCDSEEADTVRDEMDTPWLHLNSEESDRVGGLSADLYMLSNEEVFEPSDGRSKTQIGQAVLTAVKQEKWEEALALMRKPNEVPRHLIAAIRAKSYESLGHVDTSILFCDYAIVHSPDEQFASDLLLAKLFALSKAERNDEVITFARQLLEHQLLSPFQRESVAYVLVRSARYKSDAETHSIFEDVSLMLTKILDSDSSASQDAETLSIINSIVGYCHLRLGQLDLATQSYENALNLHWTDDVAEIVHDLKSKNPMAAYKQSEPVRAIGFDGEYVSRKMRSSSGLLQAA